MAQFVPLPPPKNTIRVNGLPQNVFQWLQGFEAGLATGCQEPQQKELNSNVDDEINLSFDRNDEGDGREQYDTHGVADEKSRSDGRVHVLIQVDGSKEFGSILLFGLLQCLALVDAGGRVHVNDDDEAVAGGCIRQIEVNMCSYVDQKLM